MQVITAAKVRYIPKLCKYTQKKVGIDLHKQKNSRTFAVENRTYS